MCRTALLSSLLCIATSGCALIPIPYPYDAAAPLRTVRIVDKSTGCDVPNAKVAFASELSDPRWCYWSPENAPIGLQVVLADDNLQAAGAKKISRQKDGAFMIGKRIRMAVIRPWGIGALGTHMSQWPCPTFTIDAPGYRSDGTESNVEYSIDESGAMTVILQREE